MVRAAWWWYQMAAMAPEVNTFSDVTGKMLLENGMVKIKSDNSVILWEGLAESPNPSSISPPSSSPRFIHTSFDNSSSEFYTHDWYPAGGCMDNTMSSTDTTITASVEAAINDAGGPVLRLSMMGVRLKFNPTFANGHSLEVEASCHVSAGKRLQVFQRDHFVSLTGVRQRNVTVAIHAGGLRKSLLATPWVDVSSNELRFVSSRSTACVTEELLLQC